MTMKEHIAWCKQRALGELETSGPAAALASITSDLMKHDETIRLAADPLILAGGQLAARNHDEMRHWIEGF